MQKIWKWIVAGAAVAVLVLGFQNCGPQDLTGGVEPGSEDPNPPIVDEEYDPALDGLSFPYEATFSHLAFNSCTSPSNLSSAANYNFMLSTQNVFNRTGVPKAGLGLRRQFRQTEFSAYANTLPPAQQIPALRSALLHSKNAKGYEPFIGFTQPNNGTSLARLGSTILTEPMFNTPLSEPGYVERFVADRGSQIYNYFDPVDDSLDFSIADNKRAVIQRIKLPLNDADPNFFSTGDIAPFLLTAGFGNFDEGDGPLVAAPLRPAGAIYGRGYELNYAKPISEPLGKIPYRSILTSVREIDRLTGVEVPGANWACSIRLKIVKEEDRFKAVHLQNGAGQQPRIAQACPYQPVSGLLDVDSMNKLRIIYRMFPPAHYDVNVTDNCIVPKSTGSARCYSNSNEDNIVYDDYFFPTEQADSAATPPKYSSCGGVGTSQLECARYMTICIRTDL